ncbi:MAG: CGNR zinc finger domain-containing protein [Candidatus Binatia bacterium]
MKNAQEILEWFLQFIELDLPHLRQGDWLNLQEDMRDLLGEFSSHESLTLEGLQLVQTEAQGVLRQIIKRNEPLQKRLLTKMPSHLQALHTLANLEKEEAPSAIELPLSHAKKLYLRVADGNQTQLYIQADLRTEVLFLLATTVASLDYTYLRECPACARLFFAEHGRQWFCSAKCANRAGTQRFREKQRMEERHRGRGNNETNGKRKVASPIQVGQKKQIRQKRKET